DDDRRNVGLVAGKHQAEKPEIPHQHEAKGTDAGEHQPAQEGETIVGEVTLQGLDCHMYFSRARGRGSWCGIVTQPRLGFKMHHGMPVQIRHNLPSSPNPASRLGSIRVWPPQKGAYEVRTAG